MAQTISVVVPVYDGVTQLDFTGPHQFLSRTPDVQVRVASLDGRPVTADRLTFSNLEDLGAIAACDVLLVPGGGGCLNAIENDRFLEEIARLGATARYLTSVCTGSLILIAELRGPRVAQMVQLGLEYAPQPPFDSGRPDTAPAEVLEAVNARQAAGRAERRVRFDAWAAAHRAVQAA